MVVISTGVMYLNPCALDRGLGVSLWLAKKRGRCFLRPRLLRKVDFRFAKHASDDEGRGFEPLPSLPCNGVAIPGHEAIQARSNVSTLVVTARHQLSG
jgi:hypothetical protein